MSSVSTISTSRSHSKSPPRPDGYNARREHERAPSRSSHHSRARKRRYSDSVSDHSDSSYSSGERQRSRSREWARDRNTRRRRQESSPEVRGRPRNTSEDGSRRGRTRSINMDHSRIAKERRSATPNTEQTHHPLRKDTREATIRRPSHLDNPPNNGYSRPTAQSSRRERSLSPYSKRLALTQAMNIGR
ncbi:uncharacterized protein ACLA_026110 [Aspergillus clavatus NRRL 1]|uniref:Uncharacterized protein n=1 Tax=Aspergillus clavatus (strain ATCC 1007 / CBS 513.65 / DSM 816 / NCTC 3887 / NRRL 1 / QM 1276 / 107) TaxID=344612 RepID=A1CQH3_ASPCL|nr:uncharacterized protein ACLA_026110 [Aspergillus clavatus NRRL 1]EAW07894.1 conserved hypothetical protein [Aspergillus clavatus NRRL 1]